MQQITHEMLVTIAEYDGWKISEEYELPQVVYRKGNDQVEAITIAGKENEFFSRNMRYGTSMDWLHPVAMKVLKFFQYEDKGDLPSEFWNVVNCCHLPPINGEYIGLLNAVYEAVLFINQAEQTTGKPDNV